MQLGSDDAKRKAVCAKLPATARGTSSCASGSSLPPSGATPIASRSHWLAEERTLSTTRDRDGKRVDFYCVTPRGHDADAVDRVQERLAPGALGGYCSTRTVADAVTVLTPLRADEPAFKTTMSVTVLGTPPRPACMVT